MKFQVRILVSSPLVGLDLDAEYDRLGWTDVDREASFKSRSTTVEVSRDFAKRHRNLFQRRDAFDSGTTATIKVFLERTEAADWEDWGSSGMALAYNRFDERWIEKHLT